MNRKDVPDFNLWDVFLICDFDRGKSSIFVIFCRIVSIHGRKAKTGFAKNYNSIF